MEQVFAMHSGNTGIIGGADMPTAIFLLKALLTPGGILLYSMIPVAVAVLLRLLAPVFMKEHLSWRTTLTSAALSLAGGTGLACFLFWLALGLGGPAAYPVAYPASILGGIAAFLVFCGLCGLYVWLRKRRPSWPGILVDAATSIFLLPLCTNLALWLISLVR